MLRRARFKIDYLYSGDKMPIVFFALQVDATERGVVVRDMYGQLIDHKWKKSPYLWVYLPNLLALKLI